MHNLELARRIVRLALSEAASAGQSRVSAVRVRVGAWACGEPGHLKHSFEYAARGTPLEGADLHVDLVQPSARCEDCGSSFEPATSLLKCGVCGSLRITLEQTREIEVDVLAA